MTLIKYRLGELIELSDERNAKLEFELKDVKGISTQKQIIDTKADMEDVNLSSYKIFKPSNFAYVPDTSRRGDKISLAYNNDIQSFLVSSISVVFYVSKIQILNSDYLFMFFNRPEFDRYSRFHSWGSARETFSWEEMCNIEIMLPPLDVQQKYVDIYKSMVQNQKVYEQGLDDLKLVCDAYIENLRKILPAQEIGELIENSHVINKHGKVKKIVGLYRSEFKAQRKNSDDDILRFQIITKGDIVYPPPHFGNIGTIGLYRDDENGLVSPMYVVVKSIDKSKLLPEYLIMWFQREEFKRYAFFVSCTSIRDTFDYPLLCKYKIPIPSVEVQQSIVNIYKAYIKRKEINEKIKQQIKDICPILIRGSLQEI